MDRDKIWTRDFIFLLTSNFLICLTFYLLMTSMAVYAIQQFNVTVSRAGLAASIFIVGSLIARLFVGKYIDIIGRKKMLYIGLSLFLVGSITYLFVTRIGFLMVLRLIHGIGFGMASTIMSTVSMSALPEAKRGEGTGYYSLSTASATAIGPLLALYLTNNFSYNTMFVYCIIFSVLALVSTALGKIIELDVTHEQKENIKKCFRLKDFYEKDALPITLLMFISGIAYSGITSFINSYAIEINLTKAASFFFVVYAFFLFIGRPIAGKIFDKKGENIVVYPSYVLFGISLVLITFANNGFILILAGVFLALGYGTILSSIQALVVRVSQHHRLGLAISTYYICLDAGMGIGPYILGLIAEQFGFHTMYFLLAIAIFFLIPAYYFVHGKKASTVKKSNLIRSIH